MSQHSSRQEASNAVEEADLISVTINEYIAEKRRGCARFHAKTVGFKVSPRKIQQVSSGYYSFVGTSPRTPHVKIRYDLSLSNKSDIADVSSLACVQVRERRTWRPLRNWVEVRCKTKGFSKETGLVRAT
ncbi:hypothetical protein J4E86_006289 [Alternaria arbusti]|uniref:uncharacterized protein n=1 Tax=Alternaria arbusti TaxID=232088 RepID=UPI00221E8517|nr:uncharacterized protein J4E86_006289 [Alternaria arbusti]KAI4954978.1 hypothetical protein J4E86_006289 [Alternaria arbusti]